MIPLFAIFSAYAGCYLAFHIIMEPTDNPRLVPINVLAGILVQLAGFIPVGLLYQ